MKPQDDTPVPHPDQEMGCKPTAPLSTKRVFSASQLKHTLPQTVDDIRRLMRKGRFAEMTPRQAGDDDD
jgi:hypothetical protein